MRIPITPVLAEMECKLSEAIATSNRLQCLIGETDDLMALGIVSNIRNELVNLRKTLDMLRLGGGGCFSSDNPSTAEKGHNDQAQRPGDQNA